MAWHFNNLTTQLGRRGLRGLTALINPSAHVHRPTKHVFFQGRNADGSGDGHIHEFLWDGHWNHNDLTISTGAPLATDFPSSYMFQGQGTKHVIYQGFDQGDTGRINELLWDGEWHHNELAPGTRNAPLTIGLPFGYEYSFFDPISRRNVISQRVVYHNSQSPASTLLLWDTSDGWQHTPLPGVPEAVSRPTAYVFTVHGQTVPGQASQRVLFLSLDDIPKNIHHIRELTWNEVGPNNRQWVLNDLTSLTGAPPLGSVPNAFQPVGLMHDLEFTLHVFYGRNEDRHLYELHFNDSGWHVNDLTGMTGTLGFDGPLAYVHLQQGTLNVNAISPDGHVHAISREVGQDWTPANQLDLTVAAGGAPPASSQGGLVGFVFRDLTQHIFYIADNSPISQIGDIIELTDE
jgi:hypothetical protein